MSGIPYLRVERRDDRSAVLWIDVPGEKRNLLKADFGEVLDSALDELAGEVDAIVLASAKPDDFITGADVNLLKSIRTAEEGAALSRRAQEAMARVESCRVPVVAAIHGDCLGGGLELALACRGRVASDDPRTKLGLPEVKLGLIPGAGGTQRLPARVGLEPALDLILTGKTIPARRALALGLIDEMVPRPVLIEAAVKVARRQALPPKPRGLLKRLRKSLLESNPAGRGVLFQAAKRRVLEQTHGLFPAPLRAIEAIRIGLGSGPARGYAAEAAAFGALSVTPEARQLMGLFFAITDLKKDPGAEAPARDVAKVGVLGAGLMGTGIAYVTAAEAGLDVRLKDVGHEPLRKSLRTIDGLLSERVARRRLDPRDKARILARVATSVDYSGFRAADVVIEAVVEDLEAKRSVLRDVEALGGRAIFATNTSSIPVDRIAEAAADPSRVVGMHYFSPVDRMPLLEVVAGPRTSPEVVATCVKLGKAQGKTVVVVRDGPGFYTTRILAPYVNEAVRLVVEGASVEEVDEALAGFGFPVGPLKLLDEVGLDVAGHISKVLHEAFGARMEPPPAVERLAADGRRGRKNGRGFYRYRDGRARGADPTVYGVLDARPRTAMGSDTIVRRCVLSMINEAVRCLDEGILRSERDGDVAAVMGLGFPPFLGGPFRYLAARGSSTLRDELRRFRSKYGERFAPAPRLEGAAR